LWYILILTAVDIPAIVPYKHPEHPQHRLLLVQIVWSISGWPTQY